MKMPNPTEPIKFGVFLIALILFVALVFFLLGLFVAEPVVLGQLNQEIYQVRSQLQIRKTTTTSEGTESASKTIICLRNAGGKDFQLEILEPLPADTFFAKPARDEHGNWILVPVPTIVQEQGGK